MDYSLESCRDFQLIEEHFIDVGFGGEWISDDCAQGNHRLSCSIACGTDYRARHEAVSSLSLGLLKSHVKIVDGLVVRITQLTRRSQLPVRLRQIAIDQDIDRGLQQ